MTYKRVDATQTDIVATLRLLGCSVVSLATVGKGCPDLAVSFPGRTYLVECKDGNKKWKLTPDQVQFAMDWHDDITLLESVDDAHEFVAAIRAGQLKEFHKRQYRRAVR